jgi:hypothetical protein
MSILELLTEKLESAEPNVLGNRYATIEVDGVTYSAAATSASARHSGASWNRIDYRMMGKRIAKSKLAV